MKLVYLSLEAPREGQASYTHVHEIIRGLKSRGWNDILYQPSYTHKAYSPDLFVRLLLSLKLQLRLWMGWRRGSIIYIRGHYLAFPTALIAWIFNIPIFHEINGPYEDVFIAHPGLNKFRSVLIWMQRQQYRWATGLITVTDELHNWALRESQGRPTAMISNGANVELFRPDLPKPSGLPDVYAIFFGGLSTWHGVQFMINAVNHANWPDQVHLVVIGEGQDGYLLRKEAEKNNHIHALGKKPYKDIPAYAANALVGLVPILNSGNRASTGLFPLKLFETLACGTPVIVTDFPGQADFVREHDCGLVIEADNAEALAGAVAELYAQQKAALEMGMRGYESVKNNHSWDARAGATHDFITGLLQDKN